MSNNKSQTKETLFSYMQNEHKKNKKQTVLIIGGIAISTVLALPLIAVGVGIAALSSPAIGLLAGGYYLNKKRKERKENEEFLRTYTEYRVEKNSAGKIAGYDIHKPSEQRLFYDSYGSYVGYVELEPSDWVDHSVVRDKAGNILGYKKTSEEPIVMEELKQPKKEKRKTDEFSDEAMQRNMEKHQHKFDKHSVAADIAEGSEPDEIAQIRIKIRDLTDAQNALKKERLELLNALERHNDYMERGAKRLNKALWWTKVFHKVLPMFITKEKLDGAISIQQAFERDVTARSVELEAEYREQSNKMSSLRGDIAVLEAKLEHKQNSIKEASGWQDKGKEKMDMSEFEDVDLNSDTDEQTNIHGNVQATAECVSKRPSVFSLWPFYRGTTRGSESAASSSTQQEEVQSSTRKRKSSH